jgi:hypothetical protein
VKDYIVWIHHGETPVNIVGPREENMEEDDQTYIDTYIAKLVVEVLSACEQGGGGGGG